MSDGFRRVMDKVLAGAVGLVLVLVPAIWAITWCSTEQKCEENAAEIRATQKLDRERGERVTSLEAGQKETERRLQRIETKQDSLADDVKEILRRMPR
jgi:hypothetical protein